MNPVPNQVKANILLIEDNADDAFMIGRAMRQVGPSVELNVKFDGYAALDYLRGCVMEKRSMPEIILLDLNLPGMDGFQTLAGIRGNPDTKPIPVVIFSTSDRREDVVRSYAGGACSYIVKPSVYSELESYCTEILDYWYGVSRLPVLE